jgi:hypothetical protein
MDSKQELYLCQAIETALAAQYHLTPELTDGLCIVGLDNSMVALKQKFASRVRPTSTCDNRIFSAARVQPPSLPDCPDSPDRRKPTSDRILTSQSSQRLIAGHSRP